VDFIAPAIICYRVVNMLTSSQLRISFGIPPSSVCELTMQ